jgi:hypothetical protein
MAHEGAPNRTIDRALRRWPAPERSRFEYDEMAERAVLRALSPDPSGRGSSVSDAELLQPPLPATVWERGASNFRMAGWFVVGFAAVAAASAGLFLKGEHHGARPTAAVASAGAIGVPSPSKNARPSGAAVASTLDEPGVNPADLPRAPIVDPHNPAGSGGAVAWRPIPGATARSGPVDPNAASPVAGTAPPPTDPASATDGLQPAAAVAAGSSLAGASGSVPLRPSMGALQATIGVTLPGARACLSSGDPAVHATITFRSDGSVGDVAVSGSAQGGAAEACIRSALGKARVPPFAEPSFLYPVTVRAN